MQRDLLSDTLHVSLLSILLPCLCTEECCKYPLFYDRYVREHPGSAFRVLMEDMFNARVREASDRGEEVKGVLLGNTEAHL